MTEEVGEDGRMVLGICVSASLVAISLNCIEAGVPELVDADTDSAIKFRFGPGADVVGSESVSPTPPPLPVEAGRL